MQISSTILTSLLNNCIRFFPNLRKHEYVSIYRVLLKFSRAKLSARPHYSLYCHHCLSNESDTAISFSYFFFEQLYLFSIYSVLECASFWNQDSQQLLYFQGQGWRIHLESIALGIKSAYIQYIYFDVCLENKTT